MSRLVMHKYFVIIELILAVPLGVFVLLGSLFVIPVVIGEGVREPTLTAIGISLTFILANFSLISCIALLIGFLKNKGIAKTRLEGNLYMGAIVGAVLSIVSMLLIIAVPSLENTYIAGLAMLGFGVPLLLPFGHYTYLRINA